jgi:hypothetical protein
MPGIGALLAMPFSGRLAHRFALRPLVTATIVALSACLVLPALPTSLVALCAVLLVFGAVAGLADMAMNAEGVLVEKLFGRSVMSSLHGFWSVGVLVGSAVSALASHAGIDPRVQFAVEALVLATVGAAVAQLLIEDPTTTNAPAPPHFALPTRPVLLIGLVGLCAVFGEQAGTDWSAFYIRNELGGSASVAALAVSAFAVAMATVRLMGDRVIRRLGPVRTVRISGTCAFVGAVPGGRPPGLRAARDRTRSRRPARVRRGRARRRPSRAQHRRRRRRRLRERPPRPGSDRWHRLGVVAYHVVLPRRRPGGNHRVGRGRASPRRLAVETSSATTASIDCAGLSRACTSRAGAARPRRGVTGASTFHREGSPFQTPDDPAGPARPPDHVHRLQLLLYRQVRPAEPGRRSSRWWPGRTTSERTSLGYPSQRAPVCA